VADYYAKLNQTDPSGDKVVTYSQYWNDLVEIANSNIAEADNAVTALVIYKEIASLIYGNSGKLIKEGVTPEAMEEEMNLLIAHIQSDITADPDISENVKKLVGETMTTFAEAKTALELASGTTGG
jgi:serine/threonine-protein kinase